jgi:hypothetical protein
MNMAGELDDRWLCPESCGPEGKPFGAARLRVNGRKVRTPLCVSREIPSGFRARRVKGNAPGNARGRGCEAE